MSVIKYLLYSLKNFVLSNISHWLELTRFCLLGPESKTQSSIGPKNQNLKYHTFALSASTLTKCMKWSKLLLAGLVEYVKCPSSKEMSKVVGRSLLPNTNFPVDIST